MRVKIIEGLEMGNYFPSFTRLRERNDGIVNKYVLNRVYGRMVM